MGDRAVVYSGVDLMACLPTPVHGELEFVRALLSRDPDLGECRGPLLRMRFAPRRVFVLEHIFHSQIASDLLWDGYCPDLGSIESVYFELCAAHWLDLASLCAIRASHCQRSDWAATARSLLNDLCEGGSWDPKEIANMFAWHR